MPVTEYKQINLDSNIRDTLNLFDYHRNNRTLETKTEDGWRPSSAYKNWDELHAVSLVDRIQKIIDGRYRYKVMNDLEDSTLRLAKELAEKLKKLQCVEDNNSDYLFPFKSARYVTVRDTLEMLNDLIQAYELSELLVPAEIKGPQPFFEATKEALKQDIKVDKALEPSYSMVITGRVTSEQPNYKERQCVILEEPKTVNVNTPVCELLNKFKGNFLDSASYEENITPGTSMIMVGEPQLEKDNYDKNMKKAIHMMKRFIDFTNYDLKPKTERSLELLRKAIRAVDLACTSLRIDYRNESLQEKYNNEF